MGDTWSCFSWNSKSRRQGASLQIQWKWISLLTLLRAEINRGADQPPTPRPLRVKDKRQTETPSHPPFIPSPLRIQDLIFIFHKKKLFHLSKLYLKPATLLKSPILKNIEKGLIWPIRISYIFFKFALLFSGSSC